MKTSFLSTPALSTLMALPILIGLATLPSAAIAQHKGMAMLSATLSGANEVDAGGVGNKGDEDGTGSFSGHIMTADGKLCYTLTSAGIDAPTMAHIHSGAAGKNGGVVIPFTDLTPGEHCVDVDKAKAAAIAAKPGDYYVNIHTAAYPAGAVRGQLTAN